MPSERKISPLTRKQGLQGAPRIPGDKSISHRALMLGALAEGTTEITHLLESEDVLSTWRCLEAMGIVIRKEGDRVFVEGKGMKGLRPPHSILNCGNSGTTLRLLMGILASQTFTVTLTGDESLRQRPMKRIAEPLREMGAELTLNEGEFAPLTLRGASRLRALEMSLPTASAQLKSALLLAGLAARGVTRLKGKIQSRDHTERLLPYFGAAVEVHSDSIEILGGQSLRAAVLKVPGDFSSAAFWIGAALLVKGSCLEMQNVSLNPTRTGLLEVLQRMGIEIKREVTQTHPEPFGRLRVTSQDLKAVTLGEKEIASLIDEIPLIAVLATQATGTTVVRGAQELRVKETDRIQAIALNLSAMGVQIEVFEDGFQIHGPQKLKGALLDSKEDHRIAMAFSVAALIAEGESTLQHADCVGISYPDFYQTLEQLRTFVPEQGV